MYRVGDEVTLVDEVGVYKVLTAEVDGKLIIEDEHGFDRKCTIEEVTLYKKNAFDNVEIDTFENRNVKVNPFSKKKKKAINNPVIDLHIEYLLNSHGHMNNHQIVLYQLDACRKELDKHIKAGTTQLVIIHGVGKGRLKEEVRYLLQSYPNIEYMDENYSQKGIGATKVFIK